MRPLRLFLVLLLSALAFGQAAPDTETIWHDFVGWLKAQHSINDISGDKYRASLIQSGLTAAQAQERLAVVGKLFPERRDQLGTIFANKLYMTPDQTRFTYEPNAFLVQTARRLKPGKALDVAMGQGRNAVFLATQGWDVTGYDLADEGLKAANENATKAGVRIKTVNASFDTFDYGKEQWDLIYFIYTDAPIVDPKFAERMVAALKPGGYLLIERPFLDLDLATPDPEWNAPLIEQDKPNALFKAYSSLRVLQYEDTHEIADWQQTATDRLKKQVRIVRILAKRV
jgi:2-polyprenyl-3-methyl-5-hydroxy-6-metoxy-1,4-benzoquinol methylase